jgi:TrmH family RNA methyltransferase
VTSATAGPLITQAHHPRVKAARRLAKRAFRAADRRFVVEGPQGVREGLARPGSLLELFATPEAASRHADLVAAARDRGLPVHTVSGAVMAEIAQTVTPQGILGVAGFLDVALETVLAATPTLVVVLAHARDPGNVGTILRAADAAGADAVVVTDSSVDVYNPKCTRSSAGSVFHLPVVVGVDVATAVAGLRGGGLTVLAARADAEASLDEAALSGPTAWLFGNEAWGLPPEVAELADMGVRVPIYGHAESLNLATAAAVCLYASARAQRQAGGCRT